MDPFDSAATARVWARVRGEDEAALPALLLRAVAGELEDRRAYLRLSRTRFAPQAFRALADEEGCHAARLSALYFLETGQRPAVDVISRGNIDNCTTARPRMAEALRERFRQERASVDAYLSAAKTHPQHADFFRELAAQEEAHLRRIQRLTEELLKTNRC